MTSLLDRKLLFVTGKGGVGKTTIAASLALLAVEQGKKTLVCEVDAKGNLSDLYETGPTEFKAREIQPHLWAMSMDTEASLKEYLSLQLRLPLVAKIGPLARTFDFVANAAPGVKEILTIGKFVWEVRERHYDLVVVDSVASGHIIGQLTAPQSINELVQVGMVRNQTQWMLDILNDHDQTGVVIVAAPEEMPVNETIELAGRLRDETAVELAAVVVNRVLPELFAGTEEAIFDGLQEPKVAAQLSKLAGGDVDPVLAGAELAVTLRRSRAVHLAALRSKLPSDLPLVYVPELFARTQGLRATRQVAEHLSEELGVPTAARKPTKADDRNDKVRNLEQLLAAKEIVITCGSGGVGKTTTAAALAAMAATHLGGKVLVLTVDPARRLANALGLERFGNTETRVPDEAFAASGLEPRGELWAAMLDTKQSWDDLIHRHAPDAATRESILANSLYQNISSRFVQSHDYIAMERLYEIHSSGTYDLIVVDTPPTRNVIDFLEAPDRMADFFSSRLLRWLTAPSKSRVMTLASKPFYTVADRILGSQFLEDIAEFFTLFQKMAPGFVKRAEAVTRTLSDRRTTFVVVSTLESAPLHEAEYFIEALEERKLPLGALVLNKVLPSYLRRTATTPVARSLCADADPIAAKLGADDPAATARVLATVGESFLNYQVVAKREAEQRAELAKSPDVVATVPYFDADIHDLKGLLQLGEQIWR